MAEFVRKFECLDPLEKMLCSPEHGTWWRDLLTLWRPSGQPTEEEYGLRLAIRNGYMNFYRHGQSIARVGLNRSKQPFLSVHAKYVLPEADPSVVGQEYVTLTTNSLVRRGDYPPLPYEGIQTIKGWIRAAEKYVGEEKKFVDDLLSVPANDGVIDLEMALPAWNAEDRTASRMDLVSIDSVDDQLTVFFGEVKLVTDQRLRCRAALVRDKMPEVLRQLSIYRTYLAIPEHRTNIGEQYSNAARLLVHLRQMADTIGPARPLGKAISSAAGKQLAVAELARLIVMNDESANQRAWAEHRAKLETEKERVPMIVLDAPTALKFGSRS